MKFVQLREGIAVRKSDIVSVEKLDDGGSRVWTNSASYDCPFLYESILQLLEIEEAKKEFAASMGEEPGAASDGAAPALPDMEI